MIDRDAIDLYEFGIFCRDHMAHFDGAIPCEFETTNGVVWDAAECWSVATTLGYTL